MKKVTYLLVCLLVSIGFATAQTMKVKGTVTSAEDNEPIVGASVVVKGTTTGVVTDFNGAFDINVPSSNKTLVISFVGMETVEVTAKPTMKISMKVVTQDLEGVVIVAGYGTGKKAGSIVGSVATIASEKLSNRPSANVADALQGQVAGLQVFTSSGEPSASVSMRLRGVSSINASTTPLFILDGAPVSSDVFNALNPSDIENISVLKDASSTAIYGSRAANGVVYITTKKGRGNRPTVTIKGQYGFSQLAQNKLSPMNSEQYLNFQEMLDPSLKNNAAFQADKAYTLKHGIYTDWLDYVAKNNAPTYQIDMSISGVTNTTNYYISASHLDQDGIMPRSGTKRESFRTNIETKLNEWLKVGANVGLAYQAYENTASTTNSWYNPVNFAKWARPDMSPYEIIDNPDGTISYGDRLNYIKKGGLYNPLYLLENQVDDRTKISINGNTFIQLTPIKGLTIRAAQAIDAYDYRYTGKELPMEDRNKNNGYVEEQFSRYSQITFTNTAEYKFNIAEKNHFTALIGQEAIISQQNGFSARKKGHTDKRLMLITAGTTWENPSAMSNWEDTYNSFFANVNYDYDDRYFFDASVRTDGSSLFGANNRYAVFFALGGMWNMKHEEFLKDVDFLNELKLKVNYGTVGNSGIESYAALGLVGKGQYAGETSFGLSRAANGDLTWEVVKSTNVGLSTRMFNRLSFDVEFYNKLTTNMLMEIPYSYTTGFTSGWGNVGSMRNRGIDISASYDLIANKNILWTVGANVNYNKNTITELFGGRDEYVVPNTGIKYQKGGTYGEIYYVKWAGVDPEDGYQMWYDLDGNKTKTYSDSYAQFTGCQRYAPWSGGFNTAFSWKNFSISADFSWVLGKYTINNDRYFFENPNFGASMNQSVTLLDMWTTPGQVTDIARPESSIHFDSHLIENASFLRLKNLSLGYNIPKNWITKTKILSNARIFAIARNLFTVTKYTGFDPEVDSNLQLGNYPNTRQFSFGAEITF